MRGHYPDLQPRVDVNLAHPECWNNGEGAASLDRWLREQEVLAREVETSGREALDG